MGLRNLFEGEDLIFPKFPTENTLNNFHDNLNSFINNAKTKRKMIIIMTEKKGFCFNRIQNTVENRKYIKSFKYLYSIYIFRMYYKVSSCCGCPNSTVFDRKIHTS